MGFTSIGRYDSEMAINAPGWTMDALLRDAATAKSVVSLGSNASIQENILAMRHPQTLFTLVDRNAAMLQQSREGIWNAKDINLVMTKDEQQKCIRDLGLEDILSGEGNVVRRTASLPPNLEHVEGEYPLPLGRQFDMCLAFNSLPAGVDKLTAHYFRWIFHDLLANGDLFCNEWGVFEKYQEKAIARLLPDRRRLICDRVTELINSCL